MITANDLHFIRNRLGMQQLMCGRLRLASVFKIYDTQKFTVEYSKSINLEQFEFNEEQDAMQSAVTECLLYMNFKE